VKFVRGTGRSFKSTIMRMPYSHTIAVLASTPRLGEWARRLNGPVFEKGDRYQFYDHLHAGIVNKRVHYMEFGVYEGASILHWAQINDHPKSLFVGFDTFAGLPEIWRAGIGYVIDAGAFDVGGRVPRTHDSRVTFVRGLFQETLPDYLAAVDIDAVRQSTLIVHMDADLYTSTLYVLTELDDLMRNGALVIFDEFSSVMHEFRAFEDYTSAYRRDYKVLLRTSNLVQVAVELVGVVTGAEPYLKSNRR
jgi:O-methyltransferase